MHDSKKWRRLYLRLYIKKKVLSLLDTLIEAIEYMKTNNEKDLTYILDNCLCATVQVTQTIMDDGKDYDNVLILIDKVSQTLKIALTYNKDLKIYSQLNEQVEIIKALIDKDVKVEIEIAFLPYKSSMWDCMESVWQSAQKDENCKCYVIPIPYFELNGNGVRPKLCYEGNDFPEDVPITNYLEYNIEKHHPDIIYFHNPYDDFNAVTQVEKSYFSSNLKKYTELLVYIPYFVAGACANLDNAIRMYNTPGARNADKVIAQSEKHKQLFAKCGIEPDKIIPIGSPKFDATLNTCRNNYDIPSAWKKKLKNRKVFLWNTSLDNMFTEKKWIEQIESIIEAFYKNDKCALIFRPHPLMDTAIQSMRPNYKNKYDELKQKLRSMKNAVIDNERDVYLAISVSDALISDYSSIMIQYVITGKPILSVTQMSSLKEKYIWVFDYFSNYFINDGMSIELFIDMVLRGEDLKIKDRLTAMKKSTINVDGFCGEKVHKYIKEELLDTINI